MYKIHCLNNISRFGTDLLTDSYQLVDDIDQATAVLVRSANMHDIDFPKNMLSIARAGAGVNNIPIEKCSQQGIVVFNTPGANANAVKELVLCGLFLGSRKIVDGIAWCKENKNDSEINKSVEKIKKNFAGQEILNKKLGIIGLGAIGKLVAQSAENLGMKIIGYDPFVSKEDAHKITPALTYTKNIEDIYKECDYITIHVPATKDTIKMIDKHACQLMKNNAVFLNFSRDTLIDSMAMTDALSKGQLATYITDFPTPDVMKMPNTIVIPHLGASTTEAEDNCAIMATSQTMDYIENGNIKNSVNYPACDMGIRPDNTLRVSLLHANVPNMVASITSILGDNQINIANMSNQAKGDNAYTLIDVEQEISESTIDSLSLIPEIRLVRIIK